MHVHNVMCNNEILVPTKCMVAGHQKKTITLKLRSKSDLISTSISSTVFSKMFLTVSGDMLMIGSSTFAINSKERYPLLMFMIMFVAVSNNFDMI